VSEYGEEMLVVPPNRGALKAIWIVPIVGVGLGAFGLVRLVRRWRRDDVSTPAAAAAVRSKADAPAKERDAYDARLDDELKDDDG